MAPSGAFKKKIARFYFGNGNNRRASFWEKGDLPFALDSLGKESEGHPNRM
jgi:hypothetical protein